MEISSENFPAVELRCKCAECMQQVPHQVDPRALQLLQAVRDELGEPMFITSGYRCRNHPAEKRKPSPGRHNKGLGFDIAVPWGEKRMRIVKTAMILGFKGFGFGKHFLHIDCDGEDFRSWDYN